MEAPYLSNMLDKIACDILFSEYNDFISNIGVGTMV